MTITLKGNNSNNGTVLSSTTHLPRLDAATVYSDEASLVSTYFDINEEVLNNIDTITLNAKGTLNSTLKLCIIATDIEDNRTGVMIMNSDSDPIEYPLIIEVSDYDTVKELKLVLVSTGSSSA